MQKPIKIVATSVVRGTQQGDSHGGVYLIDLQDEVVHQPIDWDSGDIDFQGRGWDRGLRGIAFDDDNVYIAASDELFVYGPDFKQRASYRNPYLKHAHEICRYGRNLYVTSTGFNSILAFDLDAKCFSWGLQIVGLGQNIRGIAFDPSLTSGPEAKNRHHINSVHCDDTGMYISGRGTQALLRFGGKEISQIASLPAGVHNARPYRDGILFNDTESDVVRFVTPSQQTALKIPSFNPTELTHTDFDDSAIARQSFARGLCELDNRRIAVGSSPSTVTIYDIEKKAIWKSVTLTMDVRNAIHGLEVWPF